MSEQTPPRWDLTNVYPSLSSKEYAADLKKLTDLIADLDAYLTGPVSKVTVNSSNEELAKAAAGIIERTNAMLLIAGTMRAYIESFVSTDSYNKEAMAKQSEFDQVAVGIDKLDVKVRGWVGSVASKLESFIELNPVTKAHPYYLREAARASKFLMSEKEEMLAAELTLSGSTAWTKLQGTVVSQHSVPFELDGQIRKLPMPALINLRSHPDGEVRRKAYEAENQAWNILKEPLAAAMNGIKGEVNTLNARRGRKDCVESAIDQSHIDRETLDAMLEAMRDSFPMFRKYFKSKAKRLGKEALAWYDLYAPVGNSTTSFTFEEAKNFVLQHFGEFSPRLRAFAQHAFDNAWIDAEQREGKRGGAFCMEVPKVGESRIMSNFDGSLDQVSTLAHELGHGFHNDCAVKAGKTEIQKFTPMTLAETASIMCETIVSHASLKQAKDDQERLAILEAKLMGDSQVIVDIYSRYLFEKEVFERREKAELSAEELCEIMEKAQKATFGDGLDERYLQKWMWTWKPHYYSAQISFYNFPYAFGLLFGTGLYAIYQQRGEAFVEDYVQLLASTGEAPAAELAARFGIDIRKKKFWQDSLAIIGKQVDEYVAIK
ncbi:MAG: M3 family oligoendopeptidase [Anaerolineaceae bacterium]|nr:M3 family oligoendopeptidase [Anaerolineaceae bacterium]